LASVFAFALWCVRLCPNGLRCGGLRQPCSWTGMEPRFARSCPVAQELFINALRRGGPRTVPDLGTPTQGSIVDGGVCPTSKLDPIRRSAERPSVCTRTCGRRFNRLEQCSLYLHRAPRAPTLHESRHSSFGLDQSSGPRQAIRRGHQEVLGLLQEGLVDVGFQQGPEPLQELSGMTNLRYPRGSQVHKHIV
jgi:hypothetical protein